MVGWLETEYAISLIRLFGAALAGALIGLERTYHGRAAGFRTHTLVCTASSVLMLLPVFGDRIVPAAVDTVVLDPTRMAQGIMTGIGFLGAGAIIKERLTVRGITTAASIWMTASIGIMIGVGMYFAALAAEVITLGALGILRMLESKVPTEHFARITIRLRPDTSISEEEIKEVITGCNLTITEPSYRMRDQMLQYELTIQTSNIDNFSKLAHTLMEIHQVDEFTILSSGT